MLCRNPFIRDKSGRAIHPAADANPMDGTPFPCGQCLPCRINQRRVWTHRIMLESMMHEHNVFVTLTYSDDFIPAGGNLEPNHMTLFLKRLRKRIHPKKIRYYYCGEYGETTYRPHYHAIIFGIGMHYDDVIADAWPYGHVHVGDVTAHSAQYVCGYVTKKITNKFDPRLVGMEPEFARMSNRPGIAANVVDKIIDVLQKYPQVIPDKKTEDVPAVLRFDGKSWPLGRYLINKLRASLAYDSDDIESVSINPYIGEIQLQYMQYQRENPGILFGDWLSEQDSQRYRQLTWKHRNFKKRKL